MDKKNRCHICGKPINLEDYEPTYEIPLLMKSDQLCFHCAFWHKRVEYDKELLKQNKVALITPKYDHWVVKVPGTILTIPTGFSGLYHAMLNPTMTYAAILDEKHKSFSLVQTNNASHQGDIPKPLRVLFKINGIFLSPEQFKELQDRRNITYEFIKNKIDNAIKIRDYLLSLHKENF